MWETDENKKLPFGKHYSINGCRQRSWVDDKMSGQKYELQDICTVSKCLSKRKLLITKGNSNLLVKKPVGYHNQQMIL